MNINWKVRFNKKNITFLTRFLVAILVPALAYLGYKAEDVTSWDAVGRILVQFISNPYLLVLTAFNAFNMIPDPTTAGLGDSAQALTYETPKEG
jgi:phi LC3 family holin